MYLPLHFLWLVAARFGCATAFLSQPQPSLRKRIPMTCSVESVQKEQAFKVLALHGKGENGPSFRRRLSKLVNACPNVTWEFLTAPHLIGGEEEFAWWTLPPNVRSYEATEYMGIDETFQLIEKAWKQNGPFSAIVGFSQGAILTSTLLAKAMKEDFCVKPEAAILFGAAWPQPFDTLLCSLESAGVRSGGYEPRTLHVYSPQDRINPPAMAARIKKIMGSSAEELVHDQGHVVPTEPSAIATIAAFLRAPSPSADVE